MKAKGATLCLTTCLLESGNVNSTSVTCAHICVYTHCLIPGYRKVEKGEGEGIRDTNGYLIRTPSVSGNERKTSALEKGGIRDGWSRYGSQCRTCVGKMCVKSVRILVTDKERGEKENVTRHG